MAYNFKDLPDISTTQPERLIKYRISEDKFSAEVLLPGLWYTDFDKKIGGKLTLWSILKIYESVRWTGFMHGLAYYPELCHGTNHTLFIASEKSEFREKINSILYDSHFSVHAPLRGLAYISEVGKSSFTFTIELYDYKTEDKILTAVTKTVYVNKTTRKPSKLPEFFFKNLNNHLDRVTNYTIERNGPPKIPVTSYRHTTKVLHSDCDLNLHANQAIYLKWCSDASTKAALGGHLKHFNKHTDLYPFKSMANQYVGEARVNSEIVVNVWEDPILSCCLHFVITSADKPIFILKLVYFDGAPLGMEKTLESKL